MPVLCVSYHLHDDGRQDFVRLANQIKRLGSCCRPTPSTWLVRTEIEPSRVADRLHSCLHGPEDKLTVFTVARGEEWCIHGSADEETAAVWMQDNIRQHHLQRPSAHADEWQRPSIFRDMRDTLHFAIEDLASKGHDYIINVRGPAEQFAGYQCTLQVVSENMLFAQGRLGLALLVAFETSSVDREAFQRFRRMPGSQRFNRQINGAVHHYAIAFGIDIPSAMQGISTVLVQVYEYPASTPFLFEVLDQGPAEITTD